MASKQNQSQNMMKAKNVTILPQVANLINTCKARQMEYRVIFHGEDEETKENNLRMTIVVDKDGKLVKQYYG